MSISRWVVFAAFRDASSCLHPLLPYSSLHFPPHLPIYALPVHPSPSSFVSSRWSPRLPSTSNRVKPFDMLLRPRLQEPSTPSPASSTPTQRTQRPPTRSPTSLKPSTPPSSSSASIDMVTISVVVYALNRPSMSVAGEENGIAWFQTSYTMNCKYQFLSLLRL